MKTYQGTAVRDGRFWAVKIAGVGITQGRSRSEARDMALDLIEIMKKIPPDQFEVHLEFEPTCG
ncbi:hypothetical protein [Amycolatopsis sp. lyj-112]|uniref:hypothetical protein n=1 Tax=Amycolatopsis sp. lyj-112 TaxID=2789288 RepID=UPI00397A0281